MNRLTAVVALLTVALSAGAQQAAPAPLVAARQKPAPEKVYTYVEQMPQLPGGGGTGAIVNEFFRRLTFPAKVYDEYYGHPMVYFEVGPTGNIQHTRIAVTSHSATLERAILAAVNSFPKFTPGYQGGQLVTVSFTLPIACLLPNR